MSNNNRRTSMKVTPMNILLCERINSANEYTEQLASAYQKNGHNVILDVQNFLLSNFLPDFVHIQWPEAIYRWRHQIPENKESLVFLQDRLTYFSSHSVPIVVTVHNLLPHSNVSNFDKEAYTIFYKFADIVVHHGESSIPQIIQDFPCCSEARHITCPHGPYPYIFADPENSRRRYGLSQSRYIFLNFGRQRADKGYTFIKKVFKSWSCKDTTLFTIGPNAKTTPTKTGKIFQLLKRNLFDSILNTVLSFITKRRKTYFRSIPHKEIPEIIAASDVIFLGHQEGLNSGIIALAVTYGKPVVYPDIGNFNEHLAGWEWQEPYDVGNVESAIDALARMRNRIQEYRPGNLVFDNAEWLNKHSWDIHVKKIVEAVDATNPSINKKP